MPHGPGWHAGKAKSLGQEHTYDANTTDVARLRRTLLELCDGGARRLRRHGLRGRTVTLKYRNADLETVTRAETLKGPTDAGAVLFASAWRLFERQHRGEAVRLLHLALRGAAPVGRPPPAGAG